MTDADIDFVQRAVNSAHADALVVALQNAVDGRRYWLLEARALLAEIKCRKLPEHYVEHWREVDARKRELEIMGDICHGA